MGDALARALGVGLDHQRVAQVRGQLAALGCHEDSPRNGDPASSHHGLGQVLVQVHVQQRGIAARESQSELLVEARVESLASAPDGAFGHVEHEVGLALQQSLHDVVGLARDLDRSHVVLELLESTAYPCNVGLCKQLSIGFGELGSHVEGDGNAHESPRATCHGWIVGTLRPSQQYSRVYFDSAQVPSSEFGARGLALQAKTPGLSPVCEVQTDPWGARAARRAARRPTSLH